MTEARVVALFGHPVSHSLSPMMHDAAYAALGLPYRYRTFDLPTYEGLFAACAELRSGTLHGANITIPHKRAAFELADVVHPTAQVPGVANVLCRDDDGRLHAHNTDADALAEDLASVLPDKPRLQAVVLGGGGAGFAAVVACQKLGFARIGVTSRSWSKRESLTSLPVAARMHALGAEVFPWPSNDVIVDFAADQSIDWAWLKFVGASSLVIQATSAGMAGADAGESVAKIVPWADLPERTLAYDVVYNPPVTPFLRAAMTHQLFARSGLGMLVRQAARSIELWTGCLPPLDLMQRVAEETLVRRGQTA